jgi:valyl-tRNA synthetase
VNRWIIGETARARMAHDEALERLPVQRCGERALCLRLGQGLRLVSGIRQAALASGDEAVIAETRATMAWVIDQCLILLHPIMPFITEELWGEIATRTRCWSMPTGPATARS